MEGQNHSVKERLEQLETFMGKYTAGGEDLCVAFSGGVDSSLILKAAVKAATKDGSKVFAVTFDSRLHPSCDLEIANRVAAELGGVHKVIHEPLLSVQKASVCKFKGNGKKPWR